MFFDCILWSDICRWFARLGSCANASQLAMPASEAIYEHITARMSRPAPDCQVFRKSSFSASMIYAPAWGCFTTWAALKSSDESRGNGRARSFCPRLTTVKNVEFGTETAEYRGELEDSTPYEATCCRCMTGPLARSALADC